MRMLVTHTIGVAAQWAASKPQADLTNTSNKVSLLIAKLANLANFQNSRRIATFANISRNPLRAHASAVPSLGQHCHSRKFCHFVVFWERNLKEFMA